MSHFWTHSIESLVPSELNSLYISPLEYEAIVFEEVVNLVDGDGEILDEVTIAVEEVVGEPGEVDDPCLREFAVYQYSRDESLMIKVQSRVTRALETISELRVITRPNYYRLLRATAGPEGMDVFAVTVAGEEGARRRASVSGGRRLLLEGANAVLLRRLAAGRFEGRFAARALDHAGRECDALYAAERLDAGLVRVVRTVTGRGGGGEAGSEEEGEAMTTVLTAEGRIVSHAWSGSSWRLEGAPPARPQTEASSESDAATDEEPPADLDAYFEKKEDLIEEIDGYLKEQPDVQDMIADLLKNLLFDKPEDVIDYADNFFSNFLGITRDSLCGYKSCSELDI